MPLVDDQPQCPGDGCQGCAGCRTAVQDPTDRPSPTVSIKLAGNGLGTVRLGDMDVSSFVSAVTITAAAGGHLEASLRVFVDELDAQDAQIRDVIQHLLLSQPAHVENVVAELLRNMYVFVPLSVCDEAARAARQIMQPFISPTPESTRRAPTEAQKAAIVAALESGNYVACDGEEIAGLPDCQPCDGTGKRFEWDELPDCTDCGGLGKLRPAGDT